MAVRHHRVATLHVPSSIQQTAPTLDGQPGQTCILYGTDYPLGGGAGFGATDCFEGGISGIALWTQPSLSCFFWATLGMNHMLRRFCAYDTTIVPRTPPPWYVSPPNFIMSLGPVSGRGTVTSSYYAVQGLFYPDSTARAFNAGYSKTTDNGATWSGWSRPAPDWMAATGLPPHYDHYNYASGALRYLSDMLVDATGRVHFFHVVVDSPWTNVAPRGILEVYETGAGWAYTWVQQNLNPRTALGYPGSSPTPYLDQTGNAIHASISPDGEVMALVWLDAGTHSPTDTLPDIWLSWRYFDWNVWSTPVNLTQTPYFPELLLHAALILKTGFNAATMFIGRSYQSNINTYPPDNSAKTTFFVSAFTWFIGPDAAGTARETPVTIEVSQNYPNPFNPSTTILYTLTPSLSQWERVSEGRVRVTLKVYDVLGREVATLVNEEKPAGRYQVTWDASNVASGVYSYRLTAGNLVATRKLLLLK